MAKANISNAKSLRRRAFSSFLRTRNARKKRRLFSLKLNKLKQVRLFCVFRVHVYNNHRFSGSHRYKSRAQASISVKSVLSVFEKKNKKQIYPIYLISIPRTCRASISDTSDTSASLITSASEIICSICGRFYNLLIKFIAH